MSEEKKPKKKRNGHVRRWLGRSALGLLIVSLGLGVWAYFAWDVANWQRIDARKITNLQQTTLLYDSEGALITSVRAVENRTIVPLERVPQHVRNAFLAAEDLRFYQHPGIDIVRIFGAVANNIRSQSYREGASTITQQLVKLSHLTDEKKLSRKVQEAYLALQLEQDYSKDDILAMYLNFINFGNGAYGLQAAAQTYFGVNVEDLSLVQGASLAAIIKSPSGYAPIQNPESNKSRRGYILDTMLSEGMIDEAAATQAKSEELVLAQKEEKPVLYGWFVDEALKEAQTLLGLSATDVLGSGHRIFTTMDPQLQNIADELYGQKNYFPPNAKDGVQAQSAFSAVDVKSGALRAIVGGRSYTVKRGLNRATDMRRSPGSAIKPLAVYGPALEQGYATASVLLDEQGDFNGYKPKNSGNTYYGRVTMRAALTSSLNVSTVRLLKEIGIPASRAFMQKSGIPLDEKDQNLSIALGSLTYGVTPVELAGAYSMFANGGVYNEPYLIERIVDSAGQTVYEHKSTGQRVVSEQNAFLMTSMLQSVATSGTASKLRATGQQVAAKTGTNSMTSGGNRDVWVAAYTPDLAVTVWMGFDNTDNAHKIGSGSTGGNLPAGLATAFFQAAYKGKEKPTFQQPKGLVWLEIDKQSIKARGMPMLASNLTPKSYRYSEVFLENNRPTQYSDVWQAPRAVQSFYIEYAEDGKPILVVNPTDTARYRIQRDSVGESIVLTEMTGTADTPIYFTDERAAYGVPYTYRVIPIHEELLGEGILLEGQQAVQIAQAKAPQQEGGILGGLTDFFSPRSDETENLGEQMESSIFW